MRNAIALLHSESRRFPQIAALIGRIEDVSDEEIASVDVPQPWYRDALTTFRDSQRYAQREAARAAALEAQQFEFLPDPKGLILRWIGDRRFVQIGQSQIEIDFGDLLFLNADGVWLDTVFGKTIGFDPRVSCARVGEGTKLSYRAAVQALIRERNPGLDVFSAEQSVPWKIIRH